MAINYWTQVGLRKIKKIDNTIYGWVLPDDVIISIVIGDH